MTTGSIDNREFQVIGHRGAAGYVPGNTAASIEKAIELGADLVEVDVQLTRDEELIVFHDNHLQNIRGYDRPVSEMTLTEIKEIYPEKLFGKRYQHERVLTLYELLDRFSEDMKFVLELKGNRLIPSLADDILQKLIPVLEDKEVFDRILVSSSDHELITSLKEQKPKINTGMITKGHWVHLDHEIESVQPDQLHPYWPYVNESILDRMHDRGLKVIPWTVNEISVGRHLKNIGVDGVFTDYPDRFLSIS